MTNWKTLRELVLARACHRCEACGAPQYAVGQWINDRFLLARASARQQFALVHAPARALADSLNEAEQPEQPYIVIVLTVVAMDEGEADKLDPATHRALCQRCDGEQKSKVEREERRAVKAKADLFENEAAAC